MHHSPPPESQSEDRYLQHVSSLIDGELDSRRLLEVIDRIADTEDCRVFYRKARALSGLVAAAEPAAATAAPASIWTAIVQRAGLESEGRSRSDALSRRIARWFQRGLPGGGPMAIAQKLNRRSVLAGASMAVILVTLTGLTWVGLRRENFNVSVSPSALSSPALSETASPNFEVATEIALGSNQSMNDSRFIDLATEILRADRRYRRELLRLMSDVERSSSTPSEGLGEGYSNSGRGSRSVEGLERDALAGSASGARVRVPMW